MRETNDMVQKNAVDKDTLLEKSLLKPIQYANLVRLGPKGDGGYVVPADQIDGCTLLISLGLSDNWDFDKEFLAMNPKARIVGVDHTIGSLWILRRIIVYSWKIFLYAIIGDRRKRSKYASKVKGHFEYFSFFREPNVHLKKRVSMNNNGYEMNLSNILDSVPQKGLSHDVFLKMDIEGSEYEVVQDITRCQNRIRCIAAEFHDLDRRAADFNKAIQDMLKYFCVVHVHGNNGAGYDQRNDFPRVVEITFVNNSLQNLKTSYSNAKYPVEGLDYANDANAPQYDLHF